MRAPVIAVVPDTLTKGPEFGDHSIALSDSYLEALSRVGALPMVMPCTTSTSAIAEYLRHCDGVMLTGGDDIQATLYAAEVDAKLKETLSPHDSKRDLAELRLIEQVFHQRKPLLAICRGLQMLNIAFGGTLYLDLPLEVPEALQHCRLDLKDDVAHAITLAADSRLAQDLGKLEIGVNSTHHQAVRKVAAPFRVTAQSSDGMVEAMELDLAERHLLPYLLAVQFHPERLLLRHSEFTDVFRTFARACVKKGSI